MVSELGVPDLRLGNIPVDRFTYERIVRLPEVENGLHQKLRLLALMPASHSNGKTGVARV